MQSDLRRLKHGQLSRRVAGSPTGVKEPHHTSASTTPTQAIHRGRGGEKKVAVGHGTDAACDYPIRKAKPEFIQVSLFEFDNRKPRACHVGANPDQQQNKTERIQKKCHPSRRKSRPAAEQDLMNSKEV